MLTPGSWFQDLNTQNQFQYTVYGFMKSSINKPSFMLPGMKTHATCIRFCPLLLSKIAEQSEDSPPHLVDLPYALIFAVATIDNIFVYSTQSTLPLAVVKNLHYDSINDLTWVGHKILVVASSDGFCSFLKIEQGIVGEPLPLESELIPEHLKDHFKELSEVSFKKNEDIANQNKG